MSISGFLKRINPKSRSLYLLVTLVLLIFGHPFFSEFAVGDVLLGLLFATTPLAGVYAVSANRRLRIFAIVLGTPALLAILEHFFLGVTPGNQWIFVLLMFVYYAFTTTGVIAHLFRRTQVDIDTIISAVSAYLMIGLTFATAHAMVGQANPDAYAGAITQGAELWANSIYHSLVTLTTLGYGDITPVSGVARSVSILEAATGVLYMGILIARLVSDYHRTRTPPDTD
jgi:hypothetical protein